MGHKDGDSGNLLHVRQGWDALKFALIKAGGNLSHVRARMGTDLL